MAIYYDDDEVKSLSTTRLNYLHQCDVKINGIQQKVTSPEMVMANTSIAGFKGVEFSQEQADAELKRLAVARKDIVKGLSKEEKAEYKIWQKDTGPKEMTEDEKAAMMKRLAENKDKPSH